MGKLAEPASRPRSGRLAFASQQSDAASTSGAATSTPPSWRRTALPLFALVGLAGLALPYDVPLSRWAMGPVLPGDLRKFVEFGEVFGHGLGVATIAIAIFQLDPARRWALPRMLAIAFSGGLAANVVKFLVVRTRPHAFDLAAGDVWHTLESWTWQRSSMNQSFPSAHTATAVAFAVALGAMYPQARRFFLALAVLVGVQRIVSGAHFTSDVCCGAAIGWLAASALLRLPGSIAWLRRLRNQETTAASVERGA